MWWVEGVHVSSIVNWSYPDYFKPVFFFFYKKVWHAQNANQLTKVKISEQKTTKATVSCAQAVLTVKVACLRFGAVLCACEMFL